MKQISSTAPQKHFPFIVMLVCINLNIIVTNYIMTKQRNFKTSYKNHTSEIQLKIVSNSNFNKNILKNLTNHW